MGTGSQQAPKQVDTSSLREPLREAVCNSFKPETLGELSQRPVQGTDRFVYHFTVVVESGQQYRFNVPEAALPADLLDLIDEL